VSCLFGAQDAQHQDLDSSPFISRPGPSPAPTAEPAVLLPADDQDYGMLYIMGPNTHRQEAQQPALPAPSPAPALEAVEGPLSPLSAAKLVEEEIRSQMQCESLACSSAHHHCSFAAGQHYVHVSVPLSSSVPVLLLMQALLLMERNPCHPCQLPHPQELSSH
jgi:hypothetical protein